MNAVSKQTEIERALTIILAYLLGFGDFNINSSTFVPNAARMLQDKGEASCRRGNFEIKLEYGLPKDEVLIVAKPNRALTESFSITTATTLNGMLTPRYASDKSWPQQLLWAYCEGLSQNGMENLTSNAILSVDTGGKSVRIQCKRGGVEQPKTRGGRAQMLVTYVDGKFVVESDLARVKPELEYLLNLPEIQS